MQPTQRPARRVVERLTGLVRCELTSDGFLPLPTDDIEVLSQQFPSREEVVLEASQGDLPDSRSKGDETPQGSKSGPRPDTAPEPSKVPESGGGPPSKRSKPTVSVTPVQPEAPDNLLEVLKGASINEEHRTIMSAVVKKVQSAKSGLTEACASLLTGFEVSNQVMRKCYNIDSSP